MNLLPERGEAFFFTHLFSEAESEEIFLRLQKEVPWRQESIRLFGREVMQPRLISWFADPGAVYGYSGRTLKAEDWTELLLSLKARAEEAAATEFNGVLLNYYRNGQDSMGWHRDNEPELGPHPVIASLTFGASRKFKLRLKERKEVAREILLTPGSCLIMRGETQRHWEHSLPKVARAEPRINLTFRRIMR